MLRERPLVLVQVRLVLLHCCFEDMTMSSAPFNIYDLRA